MRDLIQAFLLLGLGFADAQSYTFVQVDYPGSVGGANLSINNNGQILGQYIDTANAIHCYLRSPSGIYMTIDGPPDALAGTVNRRRAASVFFVARGLPFFVTGIFPAQKTPQQTATSVGAQLQQFRRSLCSSVYYAI